jgi:uncharacterized membrane protein
MPRLHESSFTTTATPERVWATWADVEAWPSWTASMTSVVAEPGALPLRVGSVFTVRQPRLAKAQWTVTELVEGREFTWSSTAPGVVSVATHLVEPADEGARVTARFEQSGWLSRPVDLLLGGLVQRYLEMESVGLKEQAER